MLVITAGGQELAMPCLTPAALWRQSDRWDEVMQLLLSGAIPVLAPCGTHTTLS